MIKGLSEPAAGVSLPPAPQAPSKPERERGGGSINEGRPKAPPTLIVNSAAVRTIEIDGENHAGGHLMGHCWQGPGDGRREGQDFGH